ncbi:MAG TPA: threonylcarbamoyl-AMP synthase [Calditrichaeota bacterium]|nr:threonylcarbamoyl-AMP synthase [Calditrichota bacterium]
MEYYKIDPNKPDKKIIAKAAAVLKSGGIIAYPTDTLYGLGVDALNEKALSRLYLLKQRGGKTPVSLMVYDLKSIEEYSGKLEPEIKEYLKKLLPGKITVLLPRKDKDVLPDLFRITKGKKLGFRIPGHNVCSALSKAFPNPITTTSANISGKPNAVNVQAIIAQFGDKLDLILDAGPVTAKQGSTIIDFTKIPFLVMREGQVSLKILRQKLPGVPLRKRKEKFTITFICSGNICRSPLAMGILRAMLARTKYRKVVEVDSAGTLNLAGQRVHEYSYEVAKENKIDLAKHISRPITDRMMQNAQLIICMALNHYTHLRSIYPQYRDKIIMLKQWKRPKNLSNPSIADPIGHPRDFFGETYREIHKELKRIFPFLIQEIKAFVEYNDL